MNRFQKNMEQIVRLAHEAVSFADNEEDRQTAIELKFAAECTLPAAKRAELPTHYPSHD